MRVDHVIYATADLAVGSAHLTDLLGVGPAGGGRHDGLGTHNTIFALGPAYVEVLAVQDAGEAGRGPLGQAVLRHLSQHGDGWMGWAMCVEDVAPVAARLGTDVITLSRSGFSARLTGVAEAAADPSLPFFVARDTGVPDPGATGTLGGLTGLRVRADAEALTDWLGALPPELEVLAGEPVGVAGIAVGGRWI